LLSLRQPGGEPNFGVLVLAAAALAHYLGPIVLLRGGDATHYVVVILPLFILVATRGAERLGELTFVLGRYWQLVPEAAEKGSDPLNLGGLTPFRRTGGFFRAVALVPLACLSLGFYAGALHTLHESYLKAEADRTALQAFALQGRRVACRNMAWFVDADVQTVMLPYGTAEDLGRYARLAGIDGFLVWDNKEGPQGFYYNFPYWSVEQFDRAICRSPLFESPRVAGNWHWYPVRHFRHRCLTANFSPNSPTGASIKR
jgi:hypothetical protein